MGSSTRLAVGLISPSSVLLNNSTNSSVWAFFKNACLLLATIGFVFVIMKNGSCFERGVPAYFSSLRESEDIDMSGSSVEPITTARRSILCLIYSS